MKNIKWVCQTNLGSIDDVIKIQDACIKHDFEYVGVKAIPFSDELPDVTNDKKTVFYGATNWIDKIYKSGRWEPGAFINDNFNYITMDKNYGPGLFNDDFKITTLGELKNKSGCYFIRPLKDNKCFSGSVVELENIQSWIDSLIEGQFDLLSEQILIASPKKIHKEWRTFMCNGEYIAGSQYKEDGRLNKNTYVPKEIIEYAEFIAGDYSPHPIFVLDICKEEVDSTPKVLEWGCFNSAGFYLANIEDIILKVSDYILYN